MGSWEASQRIALSYVEKALQAEAKRAEARPTDQALYSKIAGYCWLMAEHGQVTDDSDPHCLDRQFLVHVTGRREAVMETPWGPFHQFLLTSALDALTPLQLPVAVLHVMTDYDAHQISQRLGVPIADCHARFAKVREAFALQFGHRLDRQLRRPARPLPVQRKVMPIPKSVAHQVLPKAKHSEKSQIKRRKPKRRVVELGAQTLAALEGGPTTVYALRDRLGVSYDSARMMLTKLVKDGQVIVVGSSGPNGLAQLYALATQRVDDAESISRRVFGVEADTLAALDKHGRRTSTQIRSDVPGVTARRMSRALHRLQTLGCAELVEKDTYTGVGPIPLLWAVTDLGRRVAGKLQSPSTGTVDTTEPTDEQPPAEEAPVTVDGTVGLEEVPSVEDQDDKPEEGVKVVVGDEEFTGKHVAEIMAALTERGPMTSVEVGEYLGVLRSTADSTMRRMFKRGLVKKRWRGNIILWHLSDGKGAPAPSTRATTRTSRTSPKDKPKTKRRLKPKRRSLLSRTGAALLRLLDWLLALIGLQRVNKA